MSTLAVSLVPTGVTYSLSWNTDTFMSNGVSSGAIGNTDRKNMWAITFSNSCSITVYGGGSPTPLPSGKGIFFSIYSGSTLLTKEIGAASYSFSQSASISVVATIEDIPIVVNFNAYPGTPPVKSRTYYLHQPYGQLQAPADPPPEYGNMVFDGWYFGQEKIGDTSVVSVQYNHTLRAKWIIGSGGETPVDVFDDSKMIQQVLEDVEPVRRFALQGSCRKTFPNTPDGLSPFTGFSNYTQGIPRQYEFSDGILPDLSPNTEGKDYSGETGYRALLQDINAIGEIATREQFFRQCGGIRTFSKPVSDVIGGYPAGAMLEYWDGEHLRIVASLIDNNTFNFVDNPSLIDDEHWTFADIYTQVNMPAFIDTGKMQSDSVATFEKDIIANSSIYVSDWFTAPCDCCLIVGTESWEKLERYSQGGTCVSIGAQLRNADGTIVPSGESYSNIANGTFSMDSDTVFGLFAVKDKADDTESLWPIGYWQSQETYFYNTGNFMRTFYLKAGASFRFVYDSALADGIVMRYSCVPMTSRMSLGSSTTSVND